MAPTARCNAGKHPVAPHPDLAETFGIHRLGSEEFRMFQLNVNGKQYQVGDDVDAATPLLWVLRDTLGLVGTKYGCGVGQCSACMVHLNGAPVQSCQLPVESVVGQPITTIEGLAGEGQRLTAVQEAWIEEDVPQCGYCQAGQIMSATALLARTASPTDTDIDNAMAANICRCGTYNRIRKAIHNAAARIANPGDAKRTGGAS
jgi:aerobic-type carbon monoxide dehydrogenase small subunit (CoxS/CutS family)